MPKHTPNGKDILATLVKLLGDQEGVTITYQVKEGNSND